jgi:hypothetical protein
MRRINYQNHRVTVGKGNRPWSTDWTLNLANDSNYVIGHVGMIDHQSSLHPNTLSSAGCFLRIPLFQFCFTRPPRCIIIQKKEILYFIVKLTLNGGARKW